MKAEKKGELYIRPIQTGTTLDHLHAGTSIKILQILNITNHPVTAAMYVSSRKMGKKDLIFIEEKFLTKEDIERVSLIAPTATVNGIRLGKVFDKKQLSMPEKVVDLIRCVNPNCITNHEPLKTKFSIIKNPTRVKCFYCETTMNEREFRERIK